jgi:peptidyl-prolyl cis-trans isomerase SurA
MSRIGLGRDQGQNQPAADHWGAAKENGRRQAMSKHPYAQKVSAMLRMALLTVGFTGAALAGPFEPVKYVNGLAITQFELDQRIQFMTLLRQPGDIPTQSMNALIEDRIKQSLAKQYDFTLPPEAIQQGLEEFASQANLTADQFVTELGKGGVDKQTFRDFVASGMLWREIVRAKLGPTVTISEADIDRALAGNAPLGAMKVHLAEIVLEAKGAGRGPALEKAHQLELDLRAGADFATLARKNSIGPSARSGGMLDWLLLSQLEPDAAVAVRRLPPGGVSDPVVLEDRVVIYQMQETKQEQLPPGTNKVVDYAELVLTDGGKQATKIRNTVQSCDDLYTVAADMPAGRLTRQTVAISQVPRDVSGILMTLDPGESSAALTRGGYRVFVMLCRRGMPETDQPSRDEVRIQLTNQRLGTLAEIYLDELRADAIITDP